ncbi:MAG: hypothetical protein Q8S22_08015 [Eubacteriales bacterium]|jgi:hypothetical protein|nr:hypothetical protein [Eubacteriales bacterium]
MRLRELASFFERRQFRFQLDALMVVEIDILINEQSSFVDRFGFAAMDTSCFQNAKEVFRHCIIVAVSTP